MPLTDTAVRQAKPRAKPYKLADGGGLFLLVAPSGGKHWRVKYRVDGKEKVLSLGSYPELTLAEARDRRSETRKQLDRGDDPAVERRQEQIARAMARAQTFGVLAEEFIGKLERDRLGEATMRKVRWILEELSAPLWKRPITAITAPEILEVLRRIEARGRFETAQRARSTIARVFRYAVVTGRATTDPTPALSGALVIHRAQHRAAITDPKEFGRLLRAIDSLERSPIVKPALQLLALCYTRPGELRRAEWSEIDFEKALWSIPAERMKMRQPHSVPLPRQALELLRKHHAVTGHGHYVFPGARTARRPLSDNAFNAALRSLGFPKELVVAHGFRTTASTLLNECGHWHPDAVERSLAHQEQNAVRRAYARGEYWDERVRMGQWWADYVDAMREGRPAPNPPAARLVSEPTFGAPAGGLLSFSGGGLFGQAPAIGFTSASFVVNLPSEAEGAESLPRSGLH